MVLCGLPATGKSTLAQALSARLACEVVREAARDLADAGLDVSPLLTPSSLTTIAVLQEGREQAARLQFVADRGAIDMLAFGGWVARHHTRPIDVELLESLRSRIDAWASRAPYDVVVYLDHLVGDRGARLAAGERQFLTGLSEEFERELTRVSVPLVRAGQGWTAHTVHKALDHAVRS